MWWFQQTVDRPQPKSIAYHKSNSLAAWNLDNRQMLDAVLLGYLLKVAFDGIVGTQANQALKHLCLKGIRSFSQNGKIVNYDLEKALKRSFLKAQQQSNRSGGVEEK